MNVCAHERERFPGGGKAFTLVEMLLATAILSILLMALVSLYLQTTGTADRARARIKLAVQVNKTFDRMQEHFSTCIRDCPMGLDTPGESVAHLGDYAGTEFAFVCLNGTVDPPASRLASSQFYYIDHQTDMAGREDPTRFALYLQNQSRARTNRAFGVRHKPMSGFLDRRRRDASGSNAGWQSAQPLLPNVVSMYVYVYRYRPDGTLENITPGMDGNPDPPKQWTPWPTDIPPPEDDPGIQATSIEDMPDAVAVELGVLTPEDADALARRIEFGESVSQVMADDEDNISCRTFRRLFVFNRSPRTHLQSEK
ncbi:PulJ/GspJ family protein [Kiritimatiella glycovorans]|uniref:Cassette protein C, Verrucomicrobia group n=1 Tax=Kiritimatiella glycovorans TaxID=1307763 RepID=A0A0G3EIT1_9BACT|nr:type II secretion system protein [Kiritimatiella glycovorans]AKJ64740.1 cassette protein C, Verrucomicrobia group [Kiritimatiella glycovorans]